MTSTPLTAIEGALALPSLRSLNHLPEPFGRGWALLPPGQRWHAGLDSLYAALLRTVCIRNRQLRSYGQRVLIDSLLVGVKRTAEARVADATRPVAEPADIAAAARPDMRRIVPQGPMRIALKARSPQIVQRRTVWHRRTVAASAGVIGCVAVLAWWIVDQPLAPRHLSSDLLKSAQALMARREAPVPAPVPAPVGKPRAQPPAASPEAPVIADAVIPAPVLEPSPVDVAAAAAVPMAAPPERPPARPAPAPRDAIRSSPPRRVLHARSHPLAVNRRASNESSHQARVPTGFGEDEYADVAAFAMMSSRDVAPLPRAAASNHPPADSTEWMNHMSQRRVTEIPEQFAR
ncbi:hypothetical protein EVC45_28115 [Paraburkholderia sp. UYCP14C]|uniref:hypothetical protein n=1 Tax=Paraburkholderia sp. UYCP14C TaxID=2511130 RepID=UPI001021CD1E|nr:hypothetical protein [Paraburkholderia sp. UYCP14C]RZF26442.1 hypothetical protein EVC45_28115 [Paraburkholderia sp. UYCP14C]